MNKKLRTDSTYETSDLALSSTLSLWCPIEAIDCTSNPRKATFIFKRDENFDNLLRSYWKRELKVEPQAYFSQLKAIKTRIYSERKTW